MDSVVGFIVHHAAEAHLWIFFLLLLAGLNIPLSEDILLICGGGLVGHLIPDGGLRMFLWLYAGCLISAYEAYFLGKYFGPKLALFRPFKKALNQEKVNKMKAFLDQYGILTFLIIRFIPGGVRNLLFMTSGLVHMPFYRFILRDTPAALLSTIVLFFLGRFFGQNIDQAITFLHEWQLVFSAGLFSLLALWMAVRLLKNRRRKIEPAT